MLVSLSWVSIVKMPSILFTECLIHSVLQVSAGDSSSFETSAQLSNFWAHMELGLAKYYLVQVQIYLQLYWLPPTLPITDSPSAVNLSNLQLAGPLIPCSLSLQGPAPLAAPPIFWTNLCPSSVFLSPLVLTPQALLSYSSSTPSDMNYFSLRP